MNIIRVVYLVLKPTDNAIGQFAELTFQYLYACESVSLHLKTFLSNIVTRIYVHLDGAVKDTHTFCILVWMVLITGNEIQ